MPPDGVASEWGRILTGWILPAAVWGAAVTWWPEPSRLVIEATRLAILYVLVSS